ncbi:MAG: hypothetical protein C4326_08045 [Ignavibacteria bacterium]
MSWVFAAIADPLTQQHEQAFARIHTAPIAHTTKNTVYIAVGGLEQTMRTSLSLPGDPTDEGFAVVGTGIALDDDGCHFLSLDEWKGILRAPEPALGHLDGHFAAVRWRNDLLEAWTDQIGLRTLYAAKIEHGYVVASRLDWVAKASGCSEIDFAQLGSSWLMTNQMAYGSQVKGIERVGPGGFLRCTPSSLHVQSRAWTPTISEQHESAMVAQLRRFVQPRLNVPSVLSLGLSGGFDCRLLLAILKHSSTRFLLHSFGNPSDPDLKMASQIAEAEYLPHAAFTSPPQDASAFIELLREYSAHVGIIAPVSLLWKLHHYRALHREHRVLIDGGYGEISRRQMGNRLLRKGSTVLRRGDPNEVFPLVTAYRAAIFTPDVERRMVESAKQELAAVWRAMPSIEKIGAENFVDLFSLRTRVPNSGSPAQQWIDSQIVNYMPYAQPSFLREVFRTPLTARRNARLHRSVMRQYAPTLTRYPLTKEGVIYPYALTTLPAWLWRNVASKVGKKWVDDSPHVFLSSIREFVCDTAHSRFVKGFAYDEKKIEHDVERYYAGDRHLANEVDWWLTFELWRRSLIA